MKTETPAASAEVLYVKPSGLFVTGAGGCVYVCQWWWRRGREEVVVEEEEEEGGWGIRTSSLPESDAVRAATMAVLIWRTYNTPALIER